MTEVMATVKLARGQIAFFDDLTRIHLTVTNPIGHVLPGMNTTNIRRSVASGRIELLNGTLVSSDDIKSKRAQAKELKTAPVSIKESAPVKQEAKVEAPKVAEKPADKAPAEPVKAEKPAEAKAEEKVEPTEKKEAPKKTGTRKTTNKKTEAKTDAAQAVEEKATETK